MAFITKKILHQSLSISANAHNPESSSTYIKIFLTVLILIQSAVAVNAQRNQGSDTISVKRLLDLSFEDLMNVRVITPTQNLQNSRRAPATVMVVTMDQIKIRGYRNIAEILNDLPDFVIHNKSDPQFYNIVGARGILRQDYFVVLLDGVRISSPTNEALPFLENFPIYLAKQIEIVYGPGSALYGADAMAGVINIITQKPGDSGDMTASAMGGTQGYSNVTFLLNKKLENDFRILAGGQYSYDAQPDFSKIYKEEYDISSHHTGQFNTIYGPMSPQGSIKGKYESPIRTYNAYASIDKKGFALKILHQYVEVPTSTTFSPSNAVYNKDVFYGQSVTVGSATYSTDIGKLKSISTLVGSFFEVNPQSNYRNVYGRMERGYKYSNGSMMKMEERLSYSFSRKIDVIGGITYELFQSLPKTPELESPINRKGSVSGVLLNSASEDNPGGIEAKLFPLTYTNVGAYLQGQYFPIDQLSFTFGIRYDNNSRFGSTINPRIGAVFNPHKNTTVKVLYGTAFWAPSPIISFQSYGSFYTVDGGDTYQSAYWQLPNPNLKPITSQTVEVSINQKIGTDLSITLTAYTTHVDNLIQEVSDNGHTNLYNNKFLGWPVDYITVPYNLGSQKNHGGNLIISKTFSLGKLKLNTYSSASYTQGRLLTGEATDKKEVEQSMIVPWMFRLGVDGKVNAFHFSVRLIKAGDQRMTQFADPPNPEKRKTLNGYSLLNMSAGYTFDNRATFFINIQNALNRKYTNALPWESPELDGSLQDPIRVMAGIRASF